MTQSTLLQLQMTLNTTQWRDDPKHAHGNSKQRQTVAISCKVQTWSRRLFPNEIKETDLPHPHDLQPPSFKLCHILPKKNVSAKHEPMCRSVQVHRINNFTLTSMPSSEPAATRQELRIIWQIIPSKHRRPGKWILQVWNRRRRYDWKPENLPMEAARVCAKWEKTRRLSR